jgi:FlaA1/EpsC-like NDP-sugar epimerase
MGRIQHAEIGRVRPIYTSDVLPCLKKLDWSGFLRRPALPEPPPEFLDDLRERRILIVGAGGSIGSALALRFARFAPPALVLLETSESNLYALQKDLADRDLAACAKFVLGSVSDRALLKEIFSSYTPDLVFHAAAYKHVPLLEAQPLAAIENNVFGTAALVAEAQGARVVLLSTDKAADPASIMGATKRVAELVVTAAGGVALRLGNVLASRDSVAEVFARQIEAGQPLTVTDAMARRYFLTTEEAVNLLLAAAMDPDAGAVLAPALSAPHRVMDLAQFMARELAPGRHVPIHFTGRRPGDKKVERFWSTSESARPANSASLLQVETELISGDRLHTAIAALRRALDARDVQTAVSEVRRLVPGYSPGAELIALADQSRSRVTA